MLSIVIPTLNAAATLPGCLAALAGHAGEVVVVDGGSRDGTGTLAQAAGQRLIEAPRGRGPQLAAGAAAATGDWLLFLHADTRLAPDWPAAVADFMAASGASGRAGYFRFALDDASPAARRLERLVAWRCRHLGLPYGDQGLLLSRALYAELGGYRPLPLMEDVDLVRRIGRRRLFALPVAALTSASRYRRDGFRRRSLRNAACLALYLLGVPAHRVARLYG
ncbi:MAG: glycosyltransferase [Alphaproteobacteria bacterium]|nr:glycosyltransferase [Alphaproteobacteria bacterium]